MQKHSDVALHPLLLYKHVIRSGTFAPCSGTALSRSIASNDRSYIMGVLVEGIKADLKRSAARWLNGGSWLLRDGVLVFAKTLNFHSRCTREIQD